ncbi:hypothetical protein H0H87_003767 [Tephrocybe sp. NHM501043]|nr:hypothetical protein H0H87_003767 [Tephrocybe sp. NHM501043]
MPMGYPVSFHAHSPRAAKPTRLHPLLQSSSSPLLNFDLRQSPSTITSHYKGISLRGFTEPATQPPLPSITIVSPHLPWTATVYPSRHGTYVTVGDVIDELHHFLRKQISAKEWNSLPSEKDRRRVTDAYERRYRRISSSRDYDDEKTRGVRRVDFLMGLNKFMGLAPSAEGPGVLVFHSRE